MLLVSDLKSPEGYRETTLRQPPLVALERRADAAIRRAERLAFANAILQFVLVGVAGFSIVLSFPVPMVAMLALSWGMQRWCRSADKAAHAAELALSQEGVKLALGPMRDTLTHELLGPPRPAPTSIPGGGSKAAR